VAKRQSQSATQAQYNVPKIARQKAALIERQSEQVQIEPTDYYENVTKLTCAYLKGLYN